MSGPVGAYLDGGRRLHLQYGPIDLIIGAEGRDDEDRVTAFKAATACFDGLLERLVEELDDLHSPTYPNMPALTGPVARRMARAAQPFSQGRFLTPMIAVAGSVADEVLKAITSAAKLQRAYVNNGGDIALYLSGTAEFTVALAAHQGTSLARARIQAEHCIGGIATSGTHGRSHSFGIADSVTVLACDAATADVAATLIANAVDLPGHASIQRRPANLLSPDTDLGARLVVTNVPPLSAKERRKALANGSKEAAAMLNKKQIIGAALFLQGQSTILGDMADYTNTTRKDLCHA